MVARFEVHWTRLEPVLGSEMAKTRPAVIVSGDAINSALNTVIIAPLTSTIRGYPSRLGVEFQGKRGEIAFDQVRTVDKSRLQGRLGKLPEEYHTTACEALQELFAY